MRRYLASEHGVDFGSVLAVVYRSECVVAAFFQVWRSEDVEAGEQGFCSDVPEEFCWKVFGALYEASECCAGERLSARQSDKFGSAISEHQVRGGIGCNGLFILSLGGRVRP